MHVRARASLRVRADTAGSEGEAAEGEPRPADVEARFTPHFAASAGSSVAQDRSADRHFRLLTQKRPSLPQHPRHRREDQSAIRSHHWYLVFPIFPPFIIPALPPSLSSGPTLVKRARTTSTGDTFARQLTADRARQQITRGYVR